MKDIKKYKAPKAQVTEFECADVITNSLATSVDDRGILGHDKEKSYVNIGGKKWSEIYK